MNITPLNDKVVLKVTKKAEEVTDSGLVLPEGTKEGQNQGEVLAVGPGRVLDASIVPATVDSEGNPINATVTRLSPVVKAGDKVVFNAYAALMVTLEGEEYCLLNEGDILAVIS